MILTQKNALASFPRPFASFPFLCFPSAPPASGGNEDVFPFVLFWRQNFMSLNCDVKEGNSCLQYQQSRGDGENEKTIHVLEKLSQELDHIR